MWLRISFVFIFPPVLHLLHCITSGLCPHVVLTDDFLICQVASSGPSIQQYRPTYTTNQLDNIQAIAFNYWLTMYLFTDLFLIYGSRYLSSWSCRSELLLVIFCELFFFWSSLSVIYFWMHFIMKLVWVLLQCTVFLLCN